MTKEYRYSTAFESSYWMESNGFYVGLNMPDAIESKGDEDFVSKLPSYRKMKGMLVDEYPSAPSHWMRSEGKLASYFVGIKEGKGLWLDLNKNASHNHHVAVVISVQGINPITGLPCKDPQLEQYIECCPKCNEKFSANRHCKACGHKWPKQNYICTNATPNGTFWLDGFKTAEGVIRQYILTQEKLRGVANHVTGGNQVYAIGLSFFISKEKKKQSSKTILFGDCWNTMYYCKSTPISTPISTSIPFGDTGKLDYSAPSSVKTSNCDSADYDSCSCDLSNARSVKKLTNNCNTTKSAFQAMPEVKTKIQLEVGAGAKIDQQVYDDPEDLSFWKESPESLICINYCVEADANEILSRGRVPLNREKEGFLQGIPVGN